MTDPTTSAVDPTDEIVAVKARLDALAVVMNEGQPNEYTTGLCYEGVDQGTVLAVDPFGVKAPYRDLQPGSVIPAAAGRLLAAPEQSQPHIWAFQVEHVAKTRKLATALAIATDKSLIGWEPSTNAGPIKTFYFTVYDEFAKQGDRVQWIATRFYETELGQNPTFAP